MKKLCFVIIIQLILISQYKISHAVSVFYEFTGVVSKVNFLGPDGYQSPLSIGDTFRGFFYYTFQSMPVDMAPTQEGYGIYDRGDNFYIEYAVYFDTFTVKSGASHILIYDNSSTGKDGFVIEDFAPKASESLFNEYPPGSPGDHYFIDDLWINLFSTGGAFTSDSLPSTLNPKLFDLQSLAFRGDNGGWGSNEPHLLFDMSGEITLLSPAPVPEPTTILLFGTGLAGLAAVGRRRRD